jgi:glutathione synthase/RimK-type ligase-like ATP-grasp enzyme
MSTRPIFLLTCQDKPEPDHDEGPLLERLREEGLHVSMLAWDVPDAREVLKSASSAAHKPLLIVRSTWNYYLHLTQFVSFLRDANALAQVLNPVSVIEWNTDKRYLRDLAAEGVQIVRTAFLEPGTTLQELARVASQEEWGRAILKPSVSAGSFSTFVINKGMPKAEEAEAVSEALAARTMMLQPFLVEVEKTEEVFGGEISVVCIDNEPSHAMKKQLRLAGQNEQTVPVPLREDFADFARQVLTAATKIRPAAEGDLYARVDAVLVGGAPMLMELELTEPSLFLNANPTGMDRFVAGIMSLLRP